MYKHKIYLAGPDVFLPNAKEIGQAKKNLCDKYGFEGLFPLDNEINFDLYPTMWDTGMAIYDANHKMIEQASIVFANLTPFRGVSADPGTIEEVGEGVGLRKLVCGYSNNGKLFSERMKTLPDDGMTKEAFEMPDNLMIPGGIQRSGGFFLYRDEPFESLALFEQGLKLLQTQPYQMWLRSVSTKA